MIPTLISLIGTLLSASIANINHANGWYAFWIFATSLSSIGFFLGVVILVREGFKWL
jgi:hypothetical protein